MKILRFNRSDYQVLPFLPATFVLVVLFVAFFAHADNKPYHTDNSHKEDKIHITADRLISNSKANYIEFIGNVRATQGTTVITSNRLKIFHKSGLEEGENPIMGEESIERIVASDNVKMRFDNRVAVTQQAVYTTENRILVLTGANSKITSGENSISGPKITLYRADGRITVEGSDEERVEALFYSGENGID